MRVNTLKATREEVAAELAPFAPMPTPLSPIACASPPRSRGRGAIPTSRSSAAFQTGAFEIQDEGSQIAAILCGAREGERILDYCAGAGGKTLALAAATGNAAEIHAFDADRQRPSPRSGTVWRAPARRRSPSTPRATIFLAAQRRDGSRGGGRPLHGAGTWRRRPDAKWRLTEAQLLKRTGEQDKVLDAASRFARPGARLAYITCSC